MGIEDTGDWYSLTLLRLQQYQPATDRVSVFLSLNIRTLFHPV